MRIQIQLIILMRVRIQLLTLMRIRTLPFNLMRIHAHPDPQHYILTRANMVLKNLILSARYLHNSYNTAAPRFQRSLQYLFSWKNGIVGSGSGFVSNRPKFFNDPDPGSGAVWTLGSEIRIRDGKKSDPGSWIWDKHPRSATLLTGERGGEE